MVLRTLRLYRDMWRVRKFWQLRLAIYAIALAVIVWMQSDGADLANRTHFYLFVAAVGVPCLIELAFWRSDAQAERDRKARLLHG